jgi:hypothetical protein
MACTPALLAIEHGPAPSPTTKDLDPGHRLKAHLPGQDLRKPLI